MLLKIPIRMAEGRARAAFEMMSVGRLAAKIVPHSYKTYERRLGFLCPK